MTVGLQSLTVPCPSCQAPYDCSQLPSSTSVRTGYCTSCHTNLVFLDTSLDQENTTPRAERVGKVRKSLKATPAGWFHTLRAVAHMPVDRSFLTPSLLAGLFLFNFVLVASGFSYFYLPAIHAFDPYEIDSYYLTPVLLRINGWSSLHLAAARGDVQEVQDLVNEGADFSEKNRRGRTPLFEAAKRGRDAVVSFLLNQGIDLHEKDRQGRTILFDPVFYGHLTTVKRLLSAGSEINVQEPRSGVSLLHVAVGSMNTDMVKVLLAHHIDPNLKDKSRETPLHKLAGDERHDKPDIADLLLRAGADLEARSNLGYTPLIRAARDGHVALVRFLIEKGASLESQTVEGSTPLSLAAYSGNAESAQVLLDHGALVNTRRLDGWMPLHRAASQGHPEVVKILLRHGADLNQRVYGKTPLHLAENEGYQEVAKVLRSYGAVSFRNIFTHIQKAYDFEQKGDCPDALAEYDHALVLAPDDPELLSRQAYCLTSSGKREQALENLNRALEIYPTYFLAYQRKMYLFWEDKKWDEALETVNTFLAHQPMNARALYERAFILSAQAGKPVIRDRSSPPEAFHDLRTSCWLGWEDGCKAYRFATGENPI